MGSLSELSTRVAAFLTEPLQGKTSLNKVFWLYGLAGSALYSLLGLLFDAGDELAMRAYLVGGLLVSVYVSIATYRCAANCQSPFLARMARLSAIVSLLALPVIAYLEFTGALTLALVGEQ